MDTVYSKDLDNVLTEAGIPVVVHRYFSDYAQQFLGSCYKLGESSRFFAVGSINGKGKEWIDGLFAQGVRSYCIDMAHGDSKPCVDTVKYIKSKSEKTLIIAGNVATKSGFRHLQEAGAWAVRVGIGSGAACTTRTNCGFGVPLLTAIEDCSVVKDGSLLIADGGMKHPGDAVKAMAFGADLCMFGKQFAATSLAPGDCYDKDRNLTVDATEIVYKGYRGMASREAREGVMKRASVEGVSGLIPYSGSTERFLEDLKLNFKAALSYAGATNWKQFRLNVKKIRISNLSWVESQTHVL